MEIIVTEKFIIWDFSRVRSYLVGRFCVILRQCFLGSDFLDFCPATRRFRFDEIAAATAGVGITSTTTITQENTIFVYLPGLKVDESVYTGGPRNLRTFYLRIRLFTLVKLVQNDNFLVRNGLFI